MEATAYLKNIHISPKKLRMVIDDVRPMTPNDSLSYLLYSPKKGARILYKAVKSAMDNAKYALKVNDDLLQFKTLIVEQGNALKRFRAGGRGTAKPFKKRYSHLKIVLISRQVKKAVVKKAEVKEAPKKETSKKETVKEVKAEAKVKKVTPRKESESKK